jgi:hypothetical protein
MLIPDLTKSYVPSVIAILADLLNSELLAPPTDTDTQEKTSQNTIINITLE